MAERLSDERRGWVERYAERYGRAEHLLWNWYPGTVRYAKAVGMTWGEVRQACLVGVCRAAVRWERTGEEFLTKEAGVFVVAWMRSAVQSEAEAFHRVRKRRVSLDFEVAGGGPGPGDGLVRREAAGADYGRIEVALGASTPSERAMFVMRYNDLFGGERRTAGQVAEAFGVKVAAVRWAVKKVLARVRRGVRARVWKL